MKNQITNTIKVAYLFLQGVYIPKNQRKVAGHNLLLEYLQETNRIKVALFRIIIKVGIDRNYNIIK
jgi:hypothetical protein